MGIIKSYTSKVLALFLTLVLLCGVFPSTAFANSAKTEISGKVYEFDKDNSYEFSNSESFAEATQENTYGTFSISADIANVDNKDGVPAYEIADGNVSFFYNHSDHLLHDQPTVPHFAEDKSKKIDDVKLDSKIGKGAIVIQTSKDRTNWVDVSVTTNAFSDTPVRTEAIYSSTDVQLINGCFYRVIIAYETRVLTGYTAWVIPEYGYARYAEVYEFYAHTNSGDAVVSDPIQTYRLGTKVRAKNFDGYSGEDTIEKGDPHYGWDLGNFFVSGYTEEIVKGDNVVFLKNVGDKVTLWFNLAQNINALNGDSKLSVTTDPEGFDQYFETPTMNFGRGTLIVRHTDHNNVKGEPTIYTNYLEANVSVGADTKVQLFEEGDYEVALDYQVTSDQLIDKVGHYRIFFTFSVRNGNCMVYPFDLISGSELTNSSMTENGFRLDLAKSRYLKVNLKREMLKDSADGLVEDTRFNGPAKDGAEYTDEGIYTITVHNEYTNQFTVKKIYVGTNNILKAHVTTGLSIPEINNLVAEGATISNDGLITLASSTPSASVPAENNTDLENQEQNSQDNTNDATPNNFAIIYIIVGVVVILAVCLLVFRKKLVKSIPVVNSLDEGGDEQ